MKTSSLTYSPQHFIDLSPLATRYAVLTQAVLTFIAAGRFREVLRQSHKLTRLVRVYARLDRQNALWARKLEMLTDKGWRERVLRDLGGARKLKLWERAVKRIEARALSRGEDLARSATCPEPSWLYTPERLAESERLKAHVRKCARATAHPNITRDCVRMDFDGLFRLPPLPRLRASGGQVKVYTQSSIVDYEFNGMPFAEERGLGPAIVWPVEFYAAMRAEDEVDTQNSVIPHRGLSQSESRWMGDQLTEGSSVPHDPPSAAFGLARDDRGKLGKIPLHIALDSKTYKDLFGDLSIGRDLFDNSS